MKPTQLQPDTNAGDPSTVALLTVDEACRQLRISRWSFYRLIQQRQLATIQIGRRRLVPRKAVTAFIEQRLEATA